MKALTQGIYTALAGRSQLTTLLGSSTSIYPDKAPKGAVLPYVIIVPQDGEDKYTFSGRAFEWLPYMVKGVTGPTTDPEAGEDIATQIDAALTDAGLTVTGYTLMYGRRQGRVYYAETNADGDQYYHIGGRYRFGVDLA